MTDPKRLLDEGASDFEASLLRAGRADVPGGSARRHALAALGLLGTVVGATSTAASAASGAAAGVGAASGGAA
ncbi:MAG: hypothetical protein MUF34_31685, partial [Polyangiaceae bacterium]|nr:hypothetical protein [Polyangiaceae bacterium]